MDIGVFIDAQDVDDFVTRVGEVASAGFGSAWAPQIFGLDALTALAVAGREVPDIMLGTAVVPTYPRHPSALAVQALTTQAASGGRLTLGIGLSHQMVVENMWGLSFEKPARHMKEYLSALMPQLHDKAVGFKGETITAMGQLQISQDVPAPPVVVAALGPVMLKHAGTLADGTITWMTGTKTVGSHIVPHITRAAEDAGRPAPRVVVALPVSVTKDEAAARERAAKVFAIYGHLPSYRAMLDREGRKAHRAWRSSATKRRSCSRSRPCSLRAQPSSWLCPSSSRSPRSTFSRACSESRPIHSPLGGRIDGRHGR